MRILFLNQADRTMTGKAYQAFITAYCLAKLGHVVAYVSNAAQGFISEFYDGPTYTTDEIFDMTIKKRSAVLPATLWIDKLDFTRQADKLYEVIDVLGGSPECVFYSGDTYVASLARQVAQKWHCEMICADRHNLKLCFNGVQLRRIKRRHIERCDKIISIHSYITEEELDTLRSFRDRQKCPPQLAIVGHYLGDSCPDGVIAHSTLSDNARLSLLASATLYVHPYQDTDRQGVIEALAVGTPVITTDRFWHNDKHVTYITHEDLPTLSETYVDHSGKYAEHRFGFGARMVVLHELLGGIYGSQASGIPDV